MSEESAVGLRQEAVGGPPPLHVVAGVLVDRHDQVLIATRPPGKSFAGRWEFPGGKVGAGETAREALRRELVEELGVEISAAVPLLTVTHRYPGAAAPVTIEAWRIDAWRGEPRPLDGQQLRWCACEALAAAELLEADRPIVTALMLPELFVRVGTPEALEERLARVREPARVAWLASAPPTDPGVVRRLEERRHLLFVIDPHAPSAGRFGHVHTPARAHRDVPARGVPAGRIVHGAADAARATELGADFLLVPDRHLPEEELAAIAASGLPWYLNVADAGRGALARVAPTGRLWWPDPPLARL
jgi:8-oxo-dGTP diphosphatase